LRKPLWIVSLVAVFACAPAAHAEVLGSAGGFTYAKATESMSAEDGYSVAHPAVKCMDGDVPVGGGGALSSNPQASAIAGSYPVRRKWVAGVWNFAQSAKARATAYAVCSKRVTKISRVTATTSFANIGAQIPAPVDCLTPGSTVTAGGFSVADPTHWTDHGSFPTDGLDEGSETGDGWQIVAQHRVAAEEDLTAYVVCMEGGAPQYVSQFVQDADPVTAKVFCPAGTSVTGGGYNATGDAQGDAYPVVSKPIDSKADNDKVPDDGWLVEMSDPTFDVIAATVYAACR
jgi:hypothetical protein